MNGLQKVAESVDKVSESIDQVIDRIEGLERTQEGHVKSLDKRISEIQSRMDAKRHGAVWGGDGFKAAIPERMFNKVIGPARLACASNKREEGRSGKLYGIFNDDPVAKAAASVWLAWHIRNKVDPQFAVSNAENYAKLNQALRVEFDEAIERQVALEGGAATEGAELVPTIVQAEILRLIADNGIMRPLVRKVPMTSIQHNFPRRTGTFGAAIIDEEGSITQTPASGPFGTVALVAKKLAAFSVVSMELLQDNVVGLADYIALEFAEQIARTEDAQALEGDGTGLNFTGIVAASGVVEIQATTAASATNGGSIQYKGLVDTQYGAVQASSRNGAQWFMHPTIFARILAGRGGVASATDQGGAPLVAMVPNVLTGEPAEFLFARRSWLTSVIDIARTVGTQTDSSNIYYGPPTNIIFGDRLGFQIDLNPWAKFQTAQVDIRGMERVGIAVGVPDSFVKYTGLDVSEVMGETAA